MSEFSAALLMRSATIGPRSDQPRVSDEPLFRRADNTFHPTALTTGPWRPDAMHGGPPAALVGRAIDALREPGEHIARVNVELLRPVPLEPLTVHARRDQVSRRVTHVNVEISTGSKVVVSGRGLLLAVTPMPEPAWRPADRVLPQLAEATTVAPPAWASGDHVPTTYHQHAVEHRMPAGSAFGEPGDATSWVRLLHPLVEHEAVSPICRVLAAADFGSGISAVYRAANGVGLINADLSVALERLPRGEWVRVSAETTVDASGSALCVSELGDEEGVIGVATQGLLGLTSG